MATAATALMNSRRSMPSPIYVSLRRGPTLAPVSRYRDIFLNLGCQLVEIDVADAGQQLRPVLARGHGRVLLPVLQRRLQMFDGRGLLLGLAGLVEERQLRRTQDLLRVVVAQVCHRAQVAERQTQFLVGVSRRQFRDEAAVRSAHGPSRPRRPPAA